MDLFEAINERRSIRNFKTDPVSDELLDKIFEAVRMAPSWANTQCWRFIVVRDQELKEKVAATVPDNNPAKKAFASAPVIIAAAAKKNESGYYKGQALTPKGDWGMYDVALAMQNFCLAAHAYGLGTVQMGVFNHAQLTEILEIPEDVEVMVMTPLGFPAKPSKTPKRKEIKEFTFAEKYGRSR